MTHDEMMVELTIDNMGLISIRCRRGEHIVAEATAPAVAWSGEHPERLVARAIADSIERRVAGYLGKRGLGNRAGGGDLFSPEPEL